MKVRPLLQAAAVTAVMFTAGRLVPRARSAQRPATPPSGDAGAQVVAAAAARPEVVVVGRHRLTPSWVEAAQRDPGGANRTRQVVTTLLEGRRHASSEIDQCLARVARSSVLHVRFAVEVRSSGNELTVSDARYVSVGDGTEPLAAATAECLERYLAGHEVAEADDDAPFLADYTGPIEYVAAFALPSK